MRSTQNVPSNTTGTAITGISVARQLCRKMNITSTTSAIASSSVLTTSSIEMRMNVVESNGYDTDHPGGSDLASTSTVDLTSEATDSAFAFGASITARPDAGWPFWRMSTS